MQEHPLQHLTTLIHFLQSSQMQSLCPEAHFWITKFAWSCAFNTLVIAKVKSARRLLDANNVRLTVVSALIAV